MSVKRSIQILSIVPLLALGACGEEYVAQPYSGFPYGERTAGRGVEYVLARLLPSKGPVVEPAVMQETTIIEETPEPALESVLVPEPAPAPEIRDAAPVLEKMLRK